MKSFWWTLLVTRILQVPRKIVKSSNSSTRTCGSRSNCISVKFLIVVHTKETSEATLINQDLLMLPFNLRLFCMTISKFLYSYWLIEFQYSGLCNTCLRRTSNSKAWVQLRILNAANLLYIEKWKQAAMCDIFNRLTEKQTDDKVKKHQHTRSWGSRRQKMCVAIVSVILKAILNMPTAALKNHPMHDSWENQSTFQNSDG